ncbi:MAG: phospho-N-acetylmuramoyl-pentapeptide-transferase [Gammaproteobacteria bacterium]|nr:phospho-N-acetylmuramoyl-pentapeptide-transferase [Gammaproteobacteria bacterium]
MFLYILEYLSSINSNFQVFEYITLRAILSIITALMISLILGPYIINQFHINNMSEVIRKDGPSSHMSKSGTPTMGGLLILSSLLISTIFWANLENKYILYLIFTTISFALIGFLDDYKKLTKSKNGMPARNKIMLQLIVAGIIAYTMFAFMETTQERQLIIPFFKDVIIDLGIFFIPFVMLVIISTSNAVNLTDGLDGLAIMPVVLVSGALGIFAYLSGNINFSEYLLIPYIKDSAEITIFIGALVGSGLGFLWFNSYPAQVFMGDVGALSLGAAVGLIAIIVRQEIVLIIMGGIFVIEALSVIIQVLSFKYRKKRVFLMAPFHHHFEQKGWAEPKIVVRFWIISFILILIGLATLKLR